ncbi:Glucose oxidase [Scedosporium apiospermum]|uniref:Glucose oxidase n=1 Tax=Pseudallescheria apiosperma TaxID=563466 RepID=A0A084G4Y3_PSEDA|nr:Glucose oxidase [Scedosporium apiospermum]KEZ42395.1 Glucose oxidase [Scedosporium apiospermum]
MTSLKILSFGYALFALAVAYPTSIERARVLGRQEDVLDEYDYVIVGGGTAGLTVGDRLSEDGKYSVLAIEYGYLERDGYRPGRTTYNITSQPSPQLNNRTFNVGIGCIVGGSSAVNGQVFQRGTAGDYDIWGELGGAEDTTWTWENILGYFKKGIHFNPPEEEFAEAFNITYDLDGWGQDPDTHIYATYARGITPGVIPLYNAMTNFPGVDVPVDGANGQNGLYWFTTSMDPVNFNRSYARTGHWDGLDRENYQLLPATKVNKIVFDGDRAVGVQIHPRDHRDDTQVIKARKEVILAAGAIHTPQVLQLSGIGPRKLLKAADIEVKVDLPGVGANFQDHHYIPGVRFSWGNAPEVPELNLSSNRTGNGIALGAFLGLKAFSPDLFEDIATRYESQDAAEFLPKGTDCTIVAGYKQQKKIYARAMRDNTISFLECMLGGSPSCSPQNVHPVSRGTVTLNTTDPESEVIVDYRAASNPIDIDIMVEAIKFFRRFITTGDLAEYEALEEVPGAEYQTDEELAEWARETIIPSVYHPVGTAAKMPRKWGGVVDEDLLVYGVEGLSVVDASIMPTLVGSTTSMTVYAIAEKAADLIKSRA